MKPIITQEKNREKSDWEGCDHCGSNACLLYCGFDPYWCGLKDKFVEYTTSGIKIKDKEWQR